MRVWLAVGMIAMALLLQASKLSPLLVERTPLIEYSVEKEGAPVRLEIDYLVCYRVLRGNISDKIMELPYANGTKYVREQMASSACIDIPPEASDFSIPIIWEARLGHNLAFKESATPEPGILSLEYQGDLHILMELVVQGANVTVVMKGRYKLTLEEFMGERRESSKVFWCNSECTITLRPAMKITAFSLYAERERLPKELLDGASVALLLLALFLLASHVVPRASHRFLRLR